MGCGASTASSKAKASSHRSTPQMVAIVSDGAPLEMSHTSGGESPSGSNTSNFIESNPMEPRFAKTIVPSMHTPPGQSLHPPGGILTNGSSSGGTPKLPAPRIRTLEQPLIEDSPSRQISATFADDHRLWGSVHSTSSAATRARLAPFMSTSTLGDDQSHENLSVDGMLRRVPSAVDTPEHSSGGAFALRQSQLDAIPNEGSMTGGYEAERGRHTRLLEHDKETWSCTSPPMSLVHPSVEMSTSPSPSHSLHSVDLRDHTGVGLNTSIVAQYHSRSSAGTHASISQSDVASGLHPTVGDE